MREKDMSLDDFVRLMQIEVEKFKEDWLKNQKRNIKDWPRAMSEGDWWEQFESFTSRLPSRH